MQRVDIAIAVVALIAVAGSFIGVSTYDKPEYRRFDVNVDEHEDTANIIFSETLQGPGASQEGTWQIDQNNLTQVTFTVDLSISTPSGLPRTGATTVELEIAPPSGSNLSADTDTVTIGQDGSTGQITFTFPIQDVPTGQENVLAQDSGNALLDEEGNPVIPRTTNGTGEWTMTATVTEGGGIDLAGQNVGEEEIDVEITADYSHYSARATLRVPEGSQAV